MTPRAWTLMTAMPPTIGHEALITFANYLAPTTVILCTQPGEPYVEERRAAVRRMGIRLGVEVRTHHATIQQEPQGDDPEFWAGWGRILRGLGFQHGDYIVASEAYGLRLAEEVGGVFMPFDPGRRIKRVKATAVRKELVDRFREIIPEFQAVLRKRVTIFGAESTGKTTLAEDLSDSYFPEWARPYLEITGPELTRDKMLSIWAGQCNLQRSADALSLGNSVIYQDTDLFSTVGYWRLHEDEFGPVPQELIADALTNQSDLYLVTPSNIPFEPDPLRYGGDVREASDEFWIALLEEFGLPYVVLGRPEVRYRDALIAMDDAGIFTHKIDYQREGKEYE